MLQLRGYQTGAIEATCQEWEAGKRDVLGVAATGAGKTVIFLALLLRVLRDGQRAVILAHREELIQQPIERLRMVAGEWLMDATLSRPRVGLLMGDQKDYDRQLTVATVQTLSRETHLKKLLAHGAVDYLITDEAHHAIAPAYLKVRDGLRAANPQLRHLGVTATPMRGDGLAMANAFETTAFTITIADLVREGYLVKPSWYAISTHIDLSGIRTVGGDFQQQQLAERFDTPACRALVVAAHRELAADRPAIAFTTSVAGFSAASADGTTDKAARRQILADFRAGKYQVLVNCGLWTEGLDVPEIACIHLARPTRSDGLYIQMIGRGLRPTLTKTDCLILDYLPENARNVAMLGDILGCPIPREELLKQLAKQRRPGVSQIGFTFDGDSFDADGTDLQVVARELRYLEQSPFTWHRHHDLLTLGCGRGADGIERILAIAGQRLYAIWRHGELQPGGWKSVGAWVARPVPCDDPFAQGEALAAKHAARELAAKGRQWHQQPISEGQARWLVQLARGELRRAEIGELSRGAAANLITYYQAREAIGRFEAAQAAGAIQEAA